MLTNGHERLLFAFLPPLVPVSLSLDARRSAGRDLARHRSSRRKTTSRIESYATHMISAKGPIGVYKEGSIDSNQTPTPPSEYYNVRLREATAARPKGSC